MPTVIDEPLEHVLDPSLQKALVGHEGQWVATTRSDLIAVGDSVTEVLDRALDKGFGRDQLVVFRVPDRGARLFF